MNNNSKTVFVAMSGGVDSSVTAALLKEAGFDVVGVFMKNWSESIEGVNYCSAEADFRDMRATCQFLDIPYYTLNFEKEYKNKVLDYFFKEYQAGRTPNPDVMCNKEIKFGLFFEKARRLGADFVATGHHIALKKGKNGKVHLLRGKDRVKDQTYFVYNLNQNILKHCLFPIGEYTKPQIRQLAQKMKLPNANKKDSQGICFIGDVDVKRFLKTVIKQKRGKIVKTGGQILGEHEGAWFYTVGQRRIEGLSGQPRPLYVVDTDIKKNLVVVGEDEETYGKGVELEDLHLIDPDYTIPKIVAAKPRYGPDVYSGRLKKQKNKWQFLFDKPERALTPGQSLVIFDKEICLGGGVIKSVIK